MHAGHTHRRERTRVARASAWAIAALAALVPARMSSHAQQPAPLPVLTVPTGAPPAESPSAATIEEAVAAALQAAGVAAPAADGAAAAPAAQQPPANPFATVPAQPGGAAAAPVPAEPVPAGDPVAGESGLLVPFPGSQGAENVVVNEEEDGLVSLMVREGSLRQVVAMIAQTQNLNIVFAGASDTLVTASFDRQPWQKVLDSLLSASGHSWTTQDDVIFVSSVETADFLPPAAGGQQVEVFELDFASAVDLDQAIKGLLSQGGRSWVNESMPSDNRRTKESIAVVDYPVYLARIRDYVCQADQPPRQVFIQAHILQIELTEDCRNGINFNNLISLGSADVALKSIGFANGASPTAFFVDANGVGLDGLIELLQNTTDAKTLASPEIHAVSGQSSRLQIGEKLPYRVTTTTQTATVESVQMLDVGVVLEVTPRVTRDGRVLMRIMPKVSTGQISADTGLPSEKTSEVETDVMLASGQGMVIGGLIQELDSNIQSKLPFFGNLPYIGVIFQKRQVIKSRKEIIVTLRPFVLPYSPILQDYNDGRVYRTEEPLTQGAICRYPRPYEPRLPDTFDNWHAKHPVVPMRFGDMPVEPAWEPGDPMLDLPSVNAHWGDQVELLPEGAMPELQGP
jgi:type IV pilus assembly protein PilQ